MAKAKSKKGKPKPPPAPTTKGASGSLSASALQRWKAVYPKLAKRGPVDEELLRSYCQVWARWREAEDGLQRAGQLTQTPGGRVVQSPLVSLARQAAQDVTKLEARLGLASPPDAAPLKLLTRTELAAAFKVIPGTITRWERDGMPVAKRARRGVSSEFDLEAVKAWREKVATESDRSATYSLSSARAKESEKRTEKLEIDIAVKRGDLVFRDQVVREGQALVRALSAKIRSLPRRAEHAGVIERDQVAGLEGLCHELRQEIANWKTIADLTEAANSQ